MGRGKAGLHRPLAQDRSRATMQRIVRVTFDLLQKTPFDEIAVDRIVKRAKTSKGSFYFRFPTKSHLLRYMAESTVEEELRFWEDFFGREEWKRASLAEFLSAYVDQLADVYSDRRHFLRALMQEFDKTGDIPFRNTMERLVGQMWTLYANVVASRIREIRHPDPSTAIPFSAMLVAGILRRAFLESPRLWGRFQRETVLSEVKRTVILYLTAEWAVSTH